jgi:hypothetical protein
MGSMVTLRKGGYTRGLLKPVSRSPFGCEHVLCFDKYRSRGLAIWVGPNLKAGCAEQRLFLFAMNVSVSSASKNYCELGHLAATPL